ncbi:hypothetical protein KQR54_07465 [Mycobacterium gordonae]|uniref:hypothetical protein n=1 Tax=Mycobacterium gordonae TaxID=1778 RepID=UPI00210C93F1|nr:hypothetical protein [Mycobacterium gordonae]MCQ4360981.1 hypothetical protein [Mycobacterium gordonae]
MCRHSELLGSLANDLGTAAAAAEEAGSGVTAVSNATSISAAAKGAVGGNMPVAPHTGTG